MTDTNVSRDVENASGPKIGAFQAGAPVAAIVPRTLGELAMVAAAIIKAGLAPDSYQEKVGTNEERYEKTKAKIMIGVMKGAEVGMPPITALSTIAIIEGRPCIYGDGAVSLVQSRGVIDKIETFFEGGAETMTDPQEMEGGGLDYSPSIRDFPQTLTAVYRIWRKGQENPYEARFSVRDAMRAKLWGNPKRTPWLNYPRRMLFNRARAYALRDGFADCLMGLGIREEIEDIPAPPPPRPDTSFLDDGPPALSGPTDTPMDTSVQSERSAEPATIDHDAASQDEPAMRSGEDTQRLESPLSDHPETEKPSEPRVRSELWLQRDYGIEPPTKPNSRSYDLPGLRDRLCAIVQEAETIDELQKFEQDNATNLRRLDDASKQFGDQVRESIRSVGARLER